MRSRSSAVLLALAVAVLLPSMVVAQYTPKWRVGDWWIVKERMPSLTGRGPHWQTDRYDVLGIQEVDGKDCFALQRKTGDTTAAREGVRFVYYVRTDNWRIVRMDTYLRQAGKLIGPERSNYPEGMSGFHPFGVWFSLFPLDTSSVQDSAFHLCTSTYGASDLRQFSGIADTVLLNRYLSELDPSADHPAKPRGGAMFSVLSEMGASRELGGPDVPCGYNLQLWSTDHPWRLYEEWGQYAPPGSSSRQANYRSWLIASGHSGK